MKWNKGLLFLLVIFIFILIGCDDKNYPGDDDSYVYGGKISDIEDIYVDKVSLAESLNVARITLSLSKGNANKSSTWDVIDPDDPATDTQWVDPNGDTGNDNGYLGIGATYFPVQLPTFHNTKSDGYDGISSWQNFFADENGYVKNFMRVYPDSSEYEGYHPGDNYLITCVIGDTVYYSDTIYAWKKMRVEYDYMEGCTLSSDGFTTIKRVFNGENIFYGDDIDPNHCTYLEFRDDSTHLFRSDENIYRYAFDYNNFINEVNDFFYAYRDDSTNYPFYHVGACSLYNVSPDTFIIHGSCIYHISSDSLIYTPYISFVYIPKIINDFSYDLTKLQLKTIIGLISSHELGHFAAKLTDAYEEPENHTDSLHCVMTSSDRMAQNLRYGENMFFCPACIYRFRGNMYVKGPQVFKNGSKK